MRRSKFNESHIVAILKEAEAGRAGGADPSQASD
jgi:hypothetical protein